MLIVRNRPYLDYCNHDKKNQTILGVLCDTYRLSKAYDCIPHNLLIAKLKKHRLDKIASNFLLDYLEKTYPNSRNQKQSFTDLFQNTCSQEFRNIHRKALEIVLYTNARQMQLSVPYSECLTPQSSMFCSGCPTWNGIFMRSWAHLYRVENPGQKMWLFGVGYLEQDMRLYRATRVRHSCLKYPIRNIGTIRSPSSYKILLWLEHICFLAERIQLEISVTNFRFMLLFYLICR